MTFTVEQFVVVYARRAQGFPDALFEEVSRAFGALSPAWMQPIPPEGMLILIPYSAEAEQASANVAAHVARGHAGDDRIEFGISDGELTVQLDEAGRVQGHPFGAAVGQAIKRAK